MGKEGATKLDGYKREKKKRKLLGTSRNADDKKKKLIDRSNRYNVKNPKEKMKVGTQPVGHL